MTSILTNSAALAALSTLRSIDMDMETTQKAISSGYRVSQASDNAAYWSIATTMRSDNASLSTVQDALGLAAAKADTASSGLSTSIDLLTQIKSKLVAAREPGVDKDKVQKEITELKNQIVSVAQSASFSSENWLYNSSTSALGIKQLVGSFTRTDANNVQVQVIDFDAASSCLIDTHVASKGQLTKAITTTVPSGSTTTTATFYLLNVSTGATGTEVRIDSTTTDFALDGMIGAVDKMLQNVTDSAATLGATKARIDTQNTFVKDLSDTIAKGIGRLVDADMNMESTRLKALQTQQQLGVQALSIANTSAQNLLTLFR